MSKYKLTNPTKIAYFYVNKLYQYIKPILNYKFITH